MCKNYHKNIVKYFTINDMIKEKPTISLECCITASGKYLSENFEEV